MTAATAAKYYNDIKLCYYYYYIIDRMEDNIILRARVLSIKIIIARPLSLSSYIIILSIVTVYIIISSSYLTKKYYTFTFFQNYDVHGN